MEENKMLALGSDQAGFELKQEIISYLKEENIPFEDFGSYDTDSVDYPIYAKKVAEAVAQGDCEKGILICGTGIGMSMVANKVPGVRAALCSDCFSTEATRQHNDANVITLGARVIGPGLAVKMVDIFLNTPFSGAERHARRIQMMD